MILNTFQRFHRQLCLALLALFGLACGVLVATLLGSRLRPGTPAPRSPAPPVTIQDTALENELAFILRQQPFNPAARSSAPVNFSLRGGTTSEAIRSDLQLIGTIVAGRRSLAVVRRGAEVIRLRPGDEISGGRVETIERNTLTILNPDRSRTALRLPPTGEARAGLPATGGKSDSLTAGVRPAGHNRYVVARNTAAAARENIGEQLRLAILQPNLVGGKTDGFVIRRIQPRSLLGQLGLQPGDIIKRVNGMPLDSPEQGLQIMQQLREARRVTIDLERAGTPSSFIYEIE